MVRFTSTLTTILQCREAMHAGPRTTEFLVCAFPQFLCCVSLFLSSMYEVKKPLLLSSMRYTTFQVPHFTLVKEALIEIGCVVTSLVVGWLVVGWLVVTRVHCGQTVHPRPIVTMEH